MWTEVVKNGAKGFDLTHKLPKVYSKARCCRASEFGSLVSKYVSGKSPNTR
jgi:hypothetical protein